MVLIKTTRSFHDANHLGENIMWIGIVFLTLFSSLIGAESMDLNLKSSAFENEGQIPSKYACDGDNISPPLSWNKGPSGTKSFALIVEDPDAPVGVVTHWVLYNIPADVTSSLEGAPPKGALQGLNHYGKSQYRGPCPPSGTHRYFFRLYALDTLLKLPAGSTKEQVLNEIKSHIIGKSELMGTYSHP